MSPVAFAIAVGTLEGLFLFLGSVMVAGEQRFQLATAHAIQRRLLKDMNVR